MVTMFKVSNIRCMSIININCFKHSDLFVVEAKDGLQKLFIPRRTFSGIVLFFNGRLWEFFFSSIDSLPGIFYSLTSLCLTKCWCVELDCLRQLVIFIHEVCEKMSNSIIPDPNKHNPQLLAILWDAVKRRGDEKHYCPCTQSRGFKWRRILISTATKHCREHGDVEGGNEYRPFVGLAL